MTTALLGLALLGFGLAQPAWAHGGGAPQLTNAPAGPYRVSAWTQPDPPRAGTLHLSLAVSAPQPGAPASEAGDVVLDAAVRVQVEPLDGAGETLTAQASRQDSANKLLYEADMELPSAGQWHVEIQVQGPAGAGVAGFDLHILPAAQSPLAVPGWLPWAGLGLVVGAVAWSIYGFRTRDDRRPMTDDRSHSPLYSLPYAVQPAAARQGTPVGKPPGRQPVEESIHG